MRLSDFDYELPQKLIAQQPVEPRDAARLLVLDRGAHKHLHVGDLPDLLQPGDLLVANRSRVLPSRVLGRLSGGGRAELLLLRREGPGVWETLARPARRLRISGAGRRFSACSRRSAAEVRKRFPSDRTNDAAPGYPGEDEWSRAVRHRCAGPRNADRSARPVTCSRRQRR